MFIRDLVGEEEMILLEPGFFNFSCDHVKVFLCGSDKVDGFKMCEFFAGVVYFLDEVDIFFV